MFANSNIRRQNRNEMYSKTDRENLHHMDYHWCKQQPDNGNTTGNWDMGIVLWKVLRRTPVSVAYEKLEHIASFKDWCSDTEAKVEQVFRNRSNYGGILKVVRPEKSSDNTSHLSRDMEDLSVTRWLGDHFNCTVAQEEITADCNNYRLIALLLHANKIMLQILKTRMSPFITWQIVTE